MEKYIQVPDMISGKDLDYLSDMFEWNYGALKKVNSAIYAVSDEEIKAMLERGFELFNNNLNETLDLLSQGGINE